MQLPQSYALLAIAVAGAGGYALLSDAPPAAKPYVATEPQRPEPNDSVPGLEGADRPDEDDPRAAAQPPDRAPHDEQAPIDWTVPSQWRPLPNPSPMRIATYGVAHAPGDAVDAELSVSRAGGDVDSNVARWAGQFSGGAAPKRKVSSVRDLEVTFVDIEGAYTNTMEPGGSPHAGWAMAAAIVKTPGQPYFFKLTGPAATVRASRAAFQVLVEGIRRAASPVRPAADKGAPRR